MAESSDAANKAFDILLARLSGMKKLENNLKNAWHSIASRHSAVLCINNNDKFD
ncbi:MAG: hypothetical protein ACTS8P_01615 [Arsenophonus sp. NC-XBC3-MAG3]